MSIQAKGNNVNVGHGVPVSTRRSRFETLPTEPVALGARLLLGQRNVGTLADPHLGMRFLTPLG